ncbi:hypothetical protein HDV00_010981 [Rhizophlyctis rosea]|nr:hypothetical protein HDV00_010981 [Rhizophlyctis rosea]
MAAEDYEPQTPTPTDDNLDAPDSPVAAGFGVPAPTTPCPPHRPQHIHNIVETVDRYNPQNIPILEEYVNQLQESNEYVYDRDALLAVLKLYQFNPTYTNLSVVASILTLALSALPDPDFSVCLYLLDESHLSDPAILRLCATQRTLEQCRFKEFWASLDESSLPVDTPSEDDEPQQTQTTPTLRSLVKSHPTFLPRIRTFIASTLAQTYQTIALSRLAELLDLETADLTKWCNSVGWAVEEEGGEKVVRLPVGKENSAKPVIVQESIRFEQLTKIIGYGRLTV